jgi:hypothetical protein
MIPVGRAGDPSSFDDAIAIDHDQPRANMMTTRAATMLKTVSPRFEIPFALWRGA